MKIIHHPNDILSQKCDNVISIDPLTFSILKSEMLALCKEHNGVGLAAPQVGLAQRFFLLVTTKYPLGLMIINPVVISVFGNQSNVEGCLSIPGERRLINRPQAIRVKFVDEYNKDYETTFTCLEAQCIGHELDHLDGRLIIDYDTSN